jgi:uncharacterized protein YllA (UPF0747 family)
MCSANDCREDGGTDVIPRIVTTPLAGGARPRPLAPRRVSADVLAAVLPGPGRDRLKAGEVLVVTSGQQPGLFTGPLYTIYKALSAIAIAARLERERGSPVIPVFWVAGDDHDFAEANHAEFLNSGGEPARVVLRERPPDAPQLPLWRERCSDDVRAALDQLRAGTPETEFKAAVLAWLDAAYRPEASLADAFADALHALLGARGLAVFKFHDPAAKRAAAPFILKGLDLTLPDGLTPVLVEAALGRDRLRADNGSFVTRRSAERFTRTALERLAAEQPERLSPNVLLRPVIEAALFPTVAYAAGPAELEYFPEAAPLYRALAIEAQPAVPRWSGVLVEARVDKLLEKHALTLQDLQGTPGALEGRLVRDALPGEVAATLTALRSAIAGDYRRLAQAVEQLDPTLGRTLESARNAALAGTHDFEKKLVASLKRANETLLGQIARARAATFPTGRPQERVLTLASFAIRYGPALLDALAAEVARWADPS